VARLYVRSSCSGRPFAYRSVSLHTTLASSSPLHSIKESSNIPANIAAPNLAMGDLMKQSTRVALVFASSCFFTCTNLGQSTSAVAQQPAAPSAAPNFTCQASFGPPMPLTAPGPSAPYSAVQESSSVQTLADGTHIARKPMTTKIYSDAEGRTRTERAFCQGPGGMPDALVIEIRDPVSGYSYILDEQNKLAHRFAIQVPHASDSAVRTAHIVPAQTTRNAGVSSQESARPTVTTESLGTQTMEGVLVEGKRTTRIIPEGLEDNDRPITVVSEVWRSPELKMPVLIKTSDPRKGEMTTRLTNIELSNPILSLFQAPADYKIVDETDFVTLTLTRN
jgi:hypothetical protein